MFLHHEVLSGSLTLILSTQIPGSRFSNSLLHQYYLIIPTHISLYTGPRFRIRRDLGFGSFARSSPSPYTLHTFLIWCCNMTRNNLTWIKGDITGNIYFDHVHIEGKEVQFLKVVGCGATPIVHLNTPGAPSPNRRTLRTPQGFPLGWRVLRGKGWSWRILLNLVINKPDILKKGIHSQFLL